MKPRIIMKLTVDIAMTAALLLLMAYRMVGKAAHEWIGIGMFVLFVLHHNLNSSWCSNIRKGKYSLVRAVQTVIVFLVLCSMIGVMASGIVLSRHALSFLNIRADHSLAKNLHTVSAYWGFMLMSLHLGFHWNMMTRMAKSVFTNSSTVPKWIWKLLGLVIAGYGVYAFVRRGIGGHMLLMKHVGFSGCEEGALFFFIDYIAVMGLFVFIGNYTCMGLGIIGGRQENICKCSTADKYYNKCLKKHGDKNF